MITYGSITLTSYNSITKTEVYYYKSTSATALSGGSWSTTKPTWENGKYIWQKIKTLYEDGSSTESDAVNITGQQGATGTAATSYKLTCSNSIITKSAKGEYSVNTITFSSYSKTGTGNMVAYAGRFVIETLNDKGQWVKDTAHSSTANESTKTYTVPADIVSIRCSLYQGGGVTYLLDQMTVPIVNDGLDGQPIETKTYTGLIGSANDVANASFYFAKIHPTNFTVQWKVRFKIYITAPEAYSQSIDIQFGGYGSVFNSYDAYVVRNASLGAYFVNLYRAKAAGITNHKGHAVGIGLRASTNPTDATYARDIKVELISTESCTVDFLNTAVKYANMDGTGTTNYDNYTEMTVATAGQNATNNTNYYDRTLYNQAVKAGSAGYTSTHIVCGTSAGYVNIGANVNFDIGYPLLYSTATVTNGNTANSHYLDIPGVNYSINGTIEVGTAYKMLYLKGTLTGSTFTIASSPFMTTVVPNTPDGFYYIPLGEMSSATSGRFVSSDKLYAYLNGAFQAVDTAAQKLAEAAQTKATEALTSANNKNKIYYSTSAPTGGTFIDGDTWFDTDDDNSVHIYNGSTKKWVKQQLGENAIANASISNAKIANATIQSAKIANLDGAKIVANTITANKLATDAIKSNNYLASSNASSPYSAAGTFLDLATGNIYTPNFGVDSVNGGAYINGQVVASTGQIGDSAINYWQIGSHIDYNMNPSAAIIGHGTSFIQSGQWQISNNRINTQTYDSQNKITYLHHNSKYWDYGMQVPELDTTKSTYIDGVSNNWLYIRRSTADSIPALENNWEYLFRVDKDGTVYENGVKLSEKYASIDGVSGAYLPRSGGTITGNLTVNGTLTATASKANALSHTLSINGQSWSGSANLTINTLGVAYGGTGKTTGKDAANYFLNSLDTGSSTPVDGDYYISQYVSGGTTTTTYHRRPMSALWLYVKSKLSAADIYVPKTGGTFTGAVHVEDEFYGDSATLGNLIVNGSGRFNNGIYGNLTGTATRATKVTDSGNNTDITFAYSKTGMTTTNWLAAWNGYELRAISPAHVLTTIGAQPAGDYLLKSGGTMTGQLKWNDNNALPEATSISYLLGIDSFTSGGTTKWIKANNVVVGNASSATKAINDGDGNEISSTYLKLSGGTLTKADSVSYTAQNGEEIVSNPTSIIQSPIPKYLWHDVLAFCRICVPNYYTTSDGTTWVAGTLEKKIFANMENWGYVQILNSEIKGSRWEWINAGLYACMANWIVIGVTYASTIAKFDLLVETSSDNGSTWTQLTSSTGLYYNSTPIWIKTGGTFQNSVRITITKNVDSAANASLPICSLKLLTRRWGNQGKGSELEYPYTWDGDGNITAKGTFTGTFNGNATSASSAITATKLNSTRSFTIGKTVKNVDWSGAVSFSQTEVSDNASTSAAGWMSKDDKVKLNGIEAGAQVNTITGIKGNSETSFRTGNVNITAFNIGLGNVTNNKQVKGLSSGTTSGNLIIWGSDGYTVADSGIAKGSVTTKITLSGTDYAVSSNAITITKANLQSAIQDTSLVLMTSAERSKLSSIQVSEGGTIDFSGVTASAPITATVNPTTKAVNITHDTSGVTAGTYKSVTVNSYGHVTAGTNPTTLSGYGIIDAKITNGVITLGSNTITPLTASSTLNATKLSGTASISTTGNATTATKFSSNRSITLSGDTTGSVSSNGESGWSITTKTSKMSTLADNRTVATTPNDYKHQIIFQGLKSNGYINSPSDTIYSYLVGLRGWSDNSGGNAHELAFNDSGIFRRNGATDTWGSWYKIIDSGNYNSYSPTLTGTGASGTWDIDISGNAATATSATSATSAASATKATKDGDGNTISSTYLKLSGGTITGITQFNKTIRDVSGQHYYGGAANRSRWYKITLAHNGVIPPTTSGQWYMCSMTIHMAGDYSAGPRGTIELCYYIYWDKTKYNADKVFATGYGPNINKVKIYYNLNDPFVLYVDGNNSYTSVWVDYISYRDSAQSHNTKETKVEITDAITIEDYTVVPTTYLYTEYGNYFYTSTHLRPTLNNTLNLGDSSHKWANIYATTFNGALNGNATSATSATSAGSATKATQDSDGHQINTTYLKLAGGTMTGVLTAKENQYTDSYSGALNMNNSNIYGVNAIYTADASDNSQEGIHFYRSATTVDSLYAKAGVLYFTPNRTLGQVGTSYTVYHTGNKPSKSDVGLGNVDNTADANKVVKGVSAVAGTADSYRHVWFSDSATETYRNNDADFTYNPSTNDLKVPSVTGTTMNLSNWKIEQDSSTESLMFRYVG